MGRSSTYLITGAAGFIGSHLGQRLLGQGARVVGVDDLNDYYDPARKERNLARLGDQGDFRCHRGDIRDRAFLERVLDETGDVAAIIHLAARAGVRPSLEDPVLYADVNITGTIHLLELARHRNIDRFLFASSSSVYGSNDKVPFSETDPVERPLSPYGATKRAGELLCATYQRLWGIHATCLRYFTVYGPRQRPEMAIHLFARAIQEGRPVPFFGDGSTQRDYTYVEDIVDGTVRALERMDGFRIYNLGDSQPVPLSRLVELLEGEVVHVPKRPGEPDQTFAATDKIRRALGWRPRVSFEEGVGRMLEQIDQWREAPVWDEASIAEATRDWFAHLGGSGGEGAES